MFHSFLKMIGWPIILSTVFLLFFILLFFSCKKELTNQTVESTANISKEQYENEIDEIWDNDTESRLNTFVNLPENRIPLEVYTHQLTDREVEEQIVISRHRLKRNLELFLISPKVVSSAEGSVSDYRIVAREELDIDSEIFSLKTQDLTKDGIDQEIFVSGNEETSGLQKVYVFQLLVQGLNRDIVGLKQIFYEEGNVSYGLSLDTDGYYIVRQRLLDQRDYRLELASLRWSPGIRSFVLGKVETIDHSKQLSGSLKMLYESSASEFFTMLDGLWLRTQSIEPIGKEETAIETTKPNNKVFLYFNPEVNELLVYADTVGLNENDQVIEIYHVADTAKSLWNRLTLNVYNKYVHNIKNYFYITLENDNTMELFTLNDSSYIGRYTKVDATQFESYEQEYRHNIFDATFLLEGNFTETTNGRQYNFLPDRIVLNEPNGTIWNGSYTMFSWRGNNYLRFHLSEQLNNREQQRRTYRVERVSKGPDSSILTIVLYPVQLLRSEEINDVSADIIYLEQEQSVGHEELEELLPGG